MSMQYSRLVLAVVLSLAAVTSLMAQAGGGVNQGFSTEPIRATGPAAKKADDLIRAYTSRIEKEIEQDRKVLERIRAELKELIDLRFEMDTAIAEVRGELAAKGAYSGDPIIQSQSDAQYRKPSVPKAPVQGVGGRRDLFYGLGSALPKEPTPEQRDQLRRLAPRAGLKRMIEQLRAEVEATRIEVDQLAYKLLELRAGVPPSYLGVDEKGSGVSWFGSIGWQGGMGGGMGGGMR